MFIRSLRKRISKLFYPLLLGCLFSSALYASYPDQFYSITDVKTMLQNAEQIENIKYNSDTSALQLREGKLNGHIILNSQESEELFNRGLPSWNGTAPDASSSFAVQMRFPDGDGWSPWLTVGFWQDFIWGGSINTSYSDGHIDIDYVKLYSYQSEWQFKIIMKRNKTEYASPTIHKLSFFVSDSRTTDNVDILSIVADDPEEIFIPTDFLYQYGIDDEIGRSICSPTSVSMILKSYGIEVDPLNFARDTKDPYYGIFGVWPRVVQHAAEYGLDGAVTRYRSWSEAREVLAKGGRIAMSVGPPLYSGHLMMLAGFDENGNPLVHDPAESNGYSYKFNKTQLSRSWFNKGGIAYTFYLRDSSLVSAINENDRNKPNSPDQYILLENYPNPFNSSTWIEFAIPSPGKVDLKISDINGKLVKKLINENREKGYHKVLWQGKNSKGKLVSSGVYYVSLEFKGQRISRPISFVK